MLLFSRGDNMSASKQIKQAMLEKNIKVSDLAEKIGMKPQPLSTKLYRDTMSYSDVEKIADALGCDVRIVDRELSLIHICFLMIFLHQ